MDSGRRDRKRSGVPRRAERGWVGVQLGVVPVDVLVGTAGALVPDGKLGAEGLAYAHVGLWVRIAHSVGVRLVDRPYDPALLGVQVGLFPAPHDQLADANP